MYDSGEVLSACLNQEGLVLQHSPGAIRSAVTSLKWERLVIQGTSLTLLRQMVQLSPGDKYLEACYKHTVNILLSKLQQQQRSSKNHFCVVIYLVLKIVTANHSMHSNKTIRMQSDWKALCLF